VALPFGKLLNEVKNPFGEETLLVLLNGYSFPVLLQLMFSNARL
jgi:hypothetical protein